MIRQHWGIEADLRRVLNVGFGEDLDRKRAGHAAQNFSPSSTESPSICFKHDNSSKNAEWEATEAAGTSPICSNYSEFDMRRPWHGERSAKIWPNTLFSLFVNLEISRRKFDRNYNHIHSTGFRCGRTLVAGLVSKLIRHGQ